MSLFQSFDISGQEPIPLNQERYETEKELSKLLTRARQDKAASPYMKIQIHQVGKDGRVYMLEDA